MDKDGRLQLADSEAGDRVGKGVKLKNMNHLYDQDTAAMLLPGYMVTFEQDGIQVELRDVQKRLTALRLVGDRDWLMELHLLCLYHEQYKALWAG